MRSGRRWGSAKRIKKIRSRTADDDDGAMSVVNMIGAAQ